ncbi:Protein CBG27293 [Caenorhabditis briggsae]|uniref:Protein CBG27293 n=1 Tax=Caenorhabditis briggsae TaxID=6238 RepID=B6IM70_CAEBR|nr:Protein CBG27293 [Caenorhabditis briggsae]CAS01000.1 Protein CBG27293 [Caenorhabditis briggsae]
MMISIRKAGKLQSVKKSNPERYVLYQTLFLVLVRLLFTSMTIVDICITHFVIQASYLSCNRKHVESIFTICGFRKSNPVRDATTTETPS